MYKNGNAETETESDSECRNQVTGDRVIESMRSDPGYTRRKNLILFLEDHVAKEREQKYHNMSQKTWVDLSGKEATIQYVDRYMA